MDKASRLITVNDNPIMLSDRVFRLLYILMKNRGRMLSRKYLCRKVTGKRLCDLKSNIFDKCVSGLRGMLGPEYGKYLEVKDGVGLRFF